MLPLYLSFPDLLAAGAVGWIWKVNVKCPSVPRWTILFSLEISLKTDTAIACKNLSLCELLLFRML